MDVCLRGARAEEGRRVRPRSGRKSEGRWWGALPQGGAARVEAKALAGAVAGGHGVGALHGGARFAGGDWAHVEHGILGQQRIWRGVCIMTPSLGSYLFRPIFLRYRFGGEIDIQDRDRGQRRSQRHRWGLTCRVTPTHRVRHCKNESSKASSCDGVRPYELRSPRQARARAQRRLDLYSLVRQFPIMLHDLSQFLSPTSYRTPAHRRFRRRAACGAGELHCIRMLRD